MKDVRRKPGQTNQGIGTSEREERVEPESLVSFGGKRGALSNPSTISATFESLISLSGKQESLKETFPKKPCKTLQEVIALLREQPPTNSIVFDFTTRSPVQLFADGDKENGLALAYATTLVGELLVSLRSRIKRIEHTCSIPVWVSDQVAKGRWVTDIRTAKKDDETIIWTNERTIMDVPVCGKEKIKDLIEMLFRVISN